MKDWFMWCVGSLIGVLAIVGGWAYDGMVKEDAQLREDLRIYQGKVDFYTHELADIKATTQRLDERTQNMQSDLKEIKERLRQH